MLDKLSLKLPENAPQQQVEEMLTCDPISNVLDFRDIHCRKAKLGKDAAFLVSVAKHFFSHGSLRVAFHGQICTQEQR